MIKERMVDVLCLWNWNLYQGKFQGQFLSQETGNVAYVHEHNNFRIPTLWKNYTIINHVLVTEYDNTYVWRSILISLINYFKCKGFTSIMFLDLTKFLALKKIYTADSYLLSSSFPK